MSKSKCDALNHGSIPSTDVAEFFLGFFTKQTPEPKPSAIGPLRTNQAPWFGGGRLNVGYLVSPNVSAEYIQSGSR